MIEAVLALDGQGVGAARAYPACLAILGIGALWQAEIVFDRQFQMHRLAIAAMAIQQIELAKSTPSAIADGQIVRQQLRTRGMVQQEVPEFFMIVAQAVDQARPHLSLDRLGLLFEGI